MKGGERREERGGGGRRREERNEGLLRVYSKDWRIQVFSVLALLPSCLCSANICRVSRCQVLWQRRDTPRPIGNTDLESSAPCFRCCDDSVGCTESALRGTTPHLCLSMESSALCWNRAKLRHTEVVDRQGADLGDGRKEFSEDVV